MKNYAREIKPNLYKRFKKLDWNDVFTIAISSLVIGYVAFQIIRAKIGA